MLDNTTYKQRLLNKSTPEDYDLFFSAEAHCFLASEDCKYCPGHHPLGINGAARCNSCADFLCNVFTCDECGVECLGKKPSEWLQEALDKCEEAGLWE